MCILLFGNCQKEKSQLYPIEFEIFVEEFFLQANLREKNMHLEDYNFEIKFGDIDDTHVAGTCNRRNNEIIIDNGYWERSDEEEKEWLIFHELGHCLINRNHRNEKTLSNECLSFMKGAEDDFECSMNLYSQKWREYFLDELFNSEVNLPNWHLSNKEYESSFITNNFSIAIADTLLERVEIDSILFDTIDNFLIEIDFENWNTDVNLVQIRFGNITFANCNKCTGNKIDLYKENRSEIFHKSNDLSFNSDIKLSIIRNNDMVSFFVNEIFVHNMEYEVITGNKIQSANSFSDDLIDLKMRILLK